jgi:fatty acid desaturase
MLSRAHAPDENPAPPVRKESAPRSLPNQYAELKRLIKQRGLLDLQPAYFAGKSLLTLGLLAVGLTLLLILDNLWLQLLNAAYLAIVFVQISLIAHDMGHRQFSFRASWKNDWLTLILGNLLLGISRQWWIDKHNDHHGHPNQLDVDPDVDIPLLAFEEEQALDKRGLARFVVKYQAALIFPLSILQGLSMHRSSIQFLIEKRAKSKEHVGRSALHGSTLRGVLRLAVLGAGTFAGAALHRRPSRALRHLHGLDLRTQPQSYAPSGT